MDSSWFHGYDTANTATGNNGFMCGGYASSYTPAELLREDVEEEELLLFSSQIQHHLDEISMHMSMEDEVVYEGALDMLQHPFVDGLLDPDHSNSFPSSSSSSLLSLRSASLSCSPESSPHILGSTLTAAAAGGQYHEVSSHVPLPPAVAYTNLHVPTPAAATIARGSLAAAKTGAFKRYARHLSPRRQPKAGACGQRMFKTALSVLSKMHTAATARYNQQYYYHTSAEAAAPPPSVTQLQHVISERKRRDKLNDSFHALKTVLPPGAKKDKTSILIRATEYIRSLESKASELEEKNKSLESRLAQGSGGSDASKHACAGNGEEVKIDITKAVEEDCWGIQPRDLCTLKIAVRSQCNMTDVVFRTLQCLNHQVGDGVSLVSMNTSASNGPPQSNSSPRTVLTMQIKGAKWEEQSVKDAVAKVVAEALMLPSVETTAAEPQRQ